LKKRIVLLIIIISLVSNQCALAQLIKDTNAFTDSLTILFNTAKADTAKARILFQLSDYWSERDSAKSVSTAERAFQYTKENSFLRGVAYFYRAGAYFNYDRNKSKQDYLDADNIIKRFITQEAYQFRSRIWYNYGALEQRDGNSNEFINLMLTKALPYAEKTGDPKRMASNYMNIGATFMDLKDYTRAGEYYGKAISTLTSSDKNSLVLAECYLYNAQSLVLQGKPVNADTFLKNAYQIISSNKDSSYLPLYYRVEGMYHSRTTHWRQAIIALNKGILVARQLKRQYDEATLLYEKYDVYKQQGLLKEGKPFLEKAYELHKIYSIANDSRLLLFELARTESALGHYEAGFNRMLEYSYLTDSVFALQTAASIAEQESKYRVAEKEKALLALQNRNQVQELLLYFGAALLLLLAAFIVYIYVQRKKKETERLHSLQKELKIQVAQAQLDGEEKERRRLARDLHDGLGGMLAGIKLNLSAVNHEPGHDQNTALEKVITQIDSSVQELRRIARNMVPEALVGADFTTALRELCKTMNTKTMKVECELLNVQGKMLPAEKMEIYRIVQELLTNTVKHSGATEVFLQCSRVQQCFYITIEDNGKGFSQPLNIAQSNGIGLKNIKSRVALMNGKMEVETSPGKGTIINIEMNVTKKE